VATGRRLAQAAAPSSAPDRLLAFAAVPAPESQARRASLLRRLGSAGADVASLEPAHPGLRRALRIGVPALVLAFLALALVTQWQRLPEVDWRLEPGWLALSLPAGLGAREAGLAGALALALPPTVALAVAVGVRVVQTAVELLYAGATSALARRDRFRRPGSWATVEGTAA